MAWGIEEGDQLAIRRLHLVGADVLGDAAGFARDDAGLPDRIQKRGFAVVDVAHDRDDRRARQQGVVGILHGVDDLLDVGIGHADSLVAEFLDHQFGGVGVDGLVHRDHHAHLHERLDHVGRAFGHPVGKFRDHDGFRQLHVAHLLFGLVTQAQRLLSGLFLLALDGSHAALTATFVRDRVRQGQLARAAAFVARALCTTVGAVVLLAVGLARREARFRASRAACILGRGRGRRSSAVGRLGRCRRRSGRAGPRAKNVGLAGLGGSDLGGGFGLGGAFFLFGLQAQGFGALAFLTLLRLDLGAALGAVFLTRAVFLGTARRIFRLAGLGRTQGRQTAFHLGIGNAGGPL